MHNPANIRRVGEIYATRVILVPDEPGVYAFWWVGPKAQLMAANRRIVLRGPGGLPAAVEYRDWWPQELAYPCLYVGKTTNIKSRFSQHIKRKCPGRLHGNHPEFEKVTPMTTSCQLRFGIEHIFPNDDNPLRTICDFVGFSFSTHFRDNAIAERFFEEDRLVGIWRPWFNIDSER